MLLFRLPFFRPISGKALQNAIRAKLYIGQRFSYVVYYTGIAKVEKGPSAECRGGGPIGLTRALLGLQYFSIVNLSVPCRGKARQAKTA